MFAANPPAVRDAGGGVRPQSGGEQLGDDVADETRHADAWYAAAIWAASAALRTSTAMFRVRLAPVVRS